MVQYQAPANVLMVGSVPFQSSKEVFTNLTARLPDRLRTISDGETGERYNYIGWQLERFPSETRRPELGGTEMPNPKPQYTINSVKSTLYDQVAIASYKEFSELRSQGVIPPGIRFQICLPSPFNCLLGHLKDELMAELEPLYEQRFFESLDNLSKQIPHEDMVIQWDLCMDVIALEQERGLMGDNTRFKAYFPGPVKKGLIERLERLCQHIPADVPLAFHLCYGDLWHKHFVEPEDTAVVVDFANSIVETIGSHHTIDWLHVPVPKNRKDADYFRPLTKLDWRGQKTQLFLGLVHANDEQGTRERIEAAQSVCNQSFGVATECGLGRTPLEEIDSILAISKAVTVPQNRSASL